MSEASNNIKWPDTSQINEAAQAANYIGRGKVAYRAKIKLHGTNASVFAENGEIVAQSRTSILSTDSDNAGFHAWCRETSDFWRRLPPGIVVFGEWFGNKVQKGTSCGAIKTKEFAIFALMAVPGSALFAANYGSEPNETYLAELDAAKERPYLRSLLVTEPDQIMNTLRDMGDLPQQLHILPWAEGIELSIDFRESSEVAIEAIARWVDEVSKLDPWIASTFGVEGPGEGYVFYPQNEDGSLLSRNQFSSLAFKAKGEKHAVQKRRNPFSTKPETLPGVAEFVESYVTDARLDQCWAELERQLSRPLGYSDTGSAVRWVQADVKKESTIDLAANGLNWDQVVKAVSAAASAKFRAKLRQF